MDICAEKRQLVRTGLQDVQIDQSEVNEIGSSSKNLFTAALSQERVKRSFEIGNEKSYRWFLCEK